AKYLRDLTHSTEDWQRELAADVLSRHYSHAGSQRALVRTVGGTVRGVLSDRYRRLDSRPLLDAFLNAATKLGAVPFEGRGSDVRTSLRMVIPTVQEPTPGECLVWGLSWTNSDYGAGAYQIALFGLRLICLNGMVAEKALRTQHLGRALPDNVEFSAQTLKLDTKTMISATTDVVRSAISPEALERANQRIVEAAGEEVSTSSMLRRVSTRLSKADQKKAKELFEGDDVVMLPA